MGNQEVARELLKIAREIGGSALLKKSIMDFLDDNGGVERDTPFLMVKFRSDIGASSETKWLSISAANVEKIIKVIR